MPFVKQGGESVVLWAYFIYEGSMSAWQNKLLQIQDLDFNIKLQ